MSVSLVHFYTVGKEYFFIVLSLTGISRVVGKDGKVLKDQNIAKNASLKCLWDPSFRYVHN